LGRLEAFPEEQGRRRFLARHPAAARYAGFADFALYRVRIGRSHWVGGFARALWLDRAPTGDAALAAAFAVAEVALLAEMNERHGPALGRWRLVAVDPDGCDLADGETVRRLDFAAPLRAVGELDQALGALAAQAGSDR
jgi:putative heme iron utilization protein